MSYIYKIDGTLLKTNNIIEHMVYMDVCPIPDPCPLCDIVKEDNMTISSKISEPYIIAKKMNETNIIQVIEEYIGKLSQYNPDSTKKYILYNNLIDLRNFNELIKTARLTFRMQDNLNSDLGKLSDFDKVEVIRNLMEKNNIKNIPSIKSIGDGYIIKVNYEPMIEQFTNKIVETFNNYSVSGSFNLIIIDLEVDTNRFNRFILLSLSEKEQIGIKNTIIYNVPIQVSEKNNNVSPNPYQKDKILEIIKLFLQKIFIKPSSEKYIYYTKEMNNCSNASINFLINERGMNDTTQNNISLEDAKNKALTDISIWALEYNSEEKLAIFRTLKQDGSKPQHNFTSRYNINEIIDDRNNYNYSCSEGGNFQIFSDDTLSKSQKILVKNKYPGKQASYYACVQGCSGTCDQDEKKSFLAGSWDTYLKKDIMLEHSEYQRYPLSGEKNTAPVGNSINVEGGNCQDTKTLSDAVMLCNDTIGCESFFRYLPGSSGSQPDGPMKTCFKGYPYQENDFDKININDNNRGDMYVKKNKKKITILDEKSNDIENLRYGDFITINNKYPTDCGDQCTKEYQAYLDIFGEYQNSQPGFGLQTSQINDTVEGGSCFEIVGKGLGKNGTVMNNDIVYLISRGSVNSENRSYNGGNISIYEPQGNRNNPSNSTCTSTDYGIGTKWQTGSQPDETSEWMIRLSGDSNPQPIKNNITVNFINPKTNALLATCNWKVQGKQLGIVARTYDGRSMASSDLIWKLERTNKVRDRYVSHQLKTNNSSVCGIEGKIGIIEFWGWLSTSDNNIQWEGMKNLSGDFSCKGNWWRQFNKGSVANINNSKKWNDEWLGKAGAQATAWNKLLPITKKELDAKVKCVGHDNENTPYYYNDLYNPGCCDGKKPFTFNGVNYCKDKPSVLPEAPFGYETISKNVKCSNWDSSWVESSNEPQIGADTFDKCADACDRNSKCNEFYFNLESKKCWLANGFCTDTPSDQIHFKSLKSVKQSHCYSNTSVARFIKENIDKIEYNEIETNKLIYEIQRNKELSLKQFNKYSKSHEFGEILDIIIGYRFKVNNISFDIFDLKLDDYKIYRFLFV